MARAENYYLILEVSPNASIQDIKASFRRLARQYHPDLNPNDSIAAERFKQISQAYDILSDTTKRRRYDRDYPVYRQQKTNSTQTLIPKTAKEYYLRAIQKYQAKEYTQAIEDYTRAIELDSKFVDAYLKRCEVRNQLGDNQGVLDDCYQVFSITPNMPKAHYYQGRARFNLGYIEPAIESYTNAISQDENYAQAYYYRAIAYKELDNAALAIEDLQTAGKLFHAQKNYKAYQRTKKMIDELAKKSGLRKSHSGGLLNLIDNSLITIANYIFNPGEGLLSAYSRLSKQQAIQVGMIYGAIAILCFVIGGYYILEQQARFSVGKLFLTAAIPFFALVLASNVIRSFYRNSGNMATDIFISGAALLHLSIVALLISFIPPSLRALIIFLLIFGYSYTVITLYTGCTQILNLTEAKAAFTVALMLVISSWLSYLTLIILMI